MTPYPSSEALTWLNSILKLIQLRFLKIIYIYYTHAVYIYNYIVQNLQTCSEIIVNLIRFQLIISNNYSQMHRYNLVFRIIVYCKVNVYGDKLVILNNHSAK